MVGALEHFIHTSASEPSFWHDVVDTMNEALIVVDLDRRIVYANRKAETLTGLPRDEACGMECVDAISCPQCACMCRLFEQGEVDGLEVTVFAPESGERRTFLKNARLLRDREGTVLGGVETFRDVSKEVEERQASQRRMDSLFGGPELRTTHLPAEVLGAPVDVSELSTSDVMRQEIDERARIVDALQRSRYRRQAAASLLGIDRTTLWRRMRKLGIEI